MNNITDSVARLHRAGSEHSKSAEKLREAADNLIMWIKQNIPQNMALPKSCRIIVTPNGYEFIHYDDDVSRNRSFSHQYNGSGEIFSLLRGEKASRKELLLFSQLIADGFLEELSTLLEKEAGMFSDTTAEIEKFVASKS
ncbi:MAG: hypothetical protein RLZZ347_644 [Candidatus Parcubacteria bacterium]|jgi:hypothetical protein